MTTKQWIGIEEAAEKYQVSIRRITIRGAKDRKLLSQKLTIT